MAKCLVLGHHNQLWKMSLPHNKYFEINSNDDVQLFENVVYHKRYNENITKYKVNDIT